MTHTRTLEVQLQGWWHVGSGRGGGPDADARIRRTPGGLPTWPGRAVKGVLRAALDTHAALGLPDSPAAADVAAWFGTHLTGGDGAALLDRTENAAYRYTTQSGAVRFGSAVLGRTAAHRAAWEAWAAAGAPERRHLVHTFTTTKVGADGLVAEGSLRTLEVAAPVCLYAPLTGPSAALDAIARALPLVRSVGGHRTRGFGRAALRLLPEEAA